MGRIVKNWTPDRVEDAEVAPHLYTFDGANTPDGDELTWQEFKAKIPYKEGDVVYVEENGAAVKARILNVFFERTFLGERREKFKIQTETKRGLWSKSWTYTYPGFIQRGYKRAGLAEDVPA
jgi:hypothetical protein